MTDYQGRSGEALAVVHQLQDAFSERDTLYQRIDELVYLESQVDIPLAYQKTALRVRSPLPFHQSAAITAALSVNPPVVQREPVGRGMTAQKTANQIERFTEASRRRQEKEAKRRLLRLAMHALVTKGECVLKSLPRNRTVWAKYYDQAVSRLKVDTKKKFSEEARAHNHWAAEYKANEALPYPVCMTDVPPESFYYVKGEDGFTQVAEVKKVPYYDTLIRFGLGLGKGNGGKVAIVPQALGLPQTEWNSMMSGVPTLDMYELWDYNHCSFVLEGPWGRYEDDAYIAAGYKHPYGNDVTRTLKGPYFQCLGVSTSSRRLDRQGVSTLFAFLDLYNLYNSLLTMAHSGVYHFAGWPSFARVPQPGDGMPMPPGIGLQPSPAEQRGNTKELDWAPGQLFPFDVHAVDAPRLGFDLHKMTEDVRNMLNMAMPDVLLGMGGDTSGYAENQATHLAALYFDPLIDNMEFMLAEQTAFELFLIDNVVGEDVAAYSRSPLTGKRGDAVGWLTIGPDTIQGVYEAEVKLNPKTPSNDLLELRAIGEELKLKLKSRRMAIEQRGDSYDEVEDELLEEQLEELSTPELLQRTYQELGVKDQERLAAGAARAGAAVSGPPGAPGGLGNLGQAFEPASGQGGMPLVPGPAGSAGGAPGGGPGGVAGQPVLPQTATLPPGAG